MPFPYKSGRLRNWTATLTAYLRSETRHRQSVKCVSYIVPKCHELWSAQPAHGLKFNMHFYPPSVNSVFCFIAMLRRRRSAYGTQPNFAKRRMVNRANSCRRTVGVVLPGKMGPKNFDICSVFLRLRHLMANIF